MNEKLRKMFEAHGVDISVGSIDYWSSAIEMVMAEIYDEAVAAERQACFDLVHNHQDKRITKELERKPAYWMHCDGPKARIVFTPEPGAVAMYRQDVWTWLNQSILKNI